MTEVREAVIHEIGTVSTPLIEAQSAALAAEYQRGARVTELARKHGIRRQTVHDHLRRHGLARPLNFFTREQCDRAAELYLDVMTLAEVATAVGSNTRMVTLALEQRGIGRRPRGCRPS